MVKFLRVFLVAFVMAAVCCVGAFAADYPEEFPELDFTQYASAQFIPSNESVYFLIWEQNGTYSVLYSTYPLEVNTAGLSGELYEFHTTFDSDGYAWYGVLKIQGDTVSSVLPYAGTSDDYRRGAGNLVYSSHSLRDRATGETLFPNGYPEELPETELDPDPPYEGPNPVPPNSEVPSHSYQTAVGDDGEVEDPEVEPGTPMEDLNLVVGSIFGILTQIYNLYAGTWLLTGFLMLWLIRRVSKLFNRL